MGLTVAAPIAAAPASQGGVQKFFADAAIRDAFQSVFNRPPDESELRRYRVRIFEDHWDERDIEDDLRNRTDYRTYSRARDNRDARQMSDREVDRMIEHAYQDILGRNPDREGLRVYRSNVIDRGWTERQVRDALRSSSENRHAASDRIIGHAYREVLGRDPDTSGLYQYRDQVENHGWDEHDVIRALRNRPEYRQRNRLSDAEARAIVRRAYRSVLGRDPDPGAEGYVRGVMSDHWTERDVARELRNSEEFRNKNQ
jgi:hypothetical protein